MIEHPASSRLSPAVPTDRCVRLSRMEPTGPVPVRLLLIMRVASGVRLRWAPLRTEAVVDDRRGNAAQRAALVVGVLAQPAERCIDADVLAGGEDALGLLDNHP